MGNAGASFAQSFANTLIQGGQFIEQANARRDELDLRKKLVGAQLQEHDAKMGLLERQAKGIASLQNRLTDVSYPDSELGAGGTTPAAPLSERERTSFALQIDPTAAAKSLLDPKQDMRALFRSIMQGDAEMPGFTGASPGKATQPAEPAPAVAGPAPEAGQPTTPSLGPQRKLDRKLTLDSDGKLSLTLGDRNVNYKMEHVTAVNPADGKPWVYRIITDPENPARTQTYPMAPAPPPEAIAKIDTAVTSMGLRPGTELHAAAVADVLYATTALQGREQTEALAIIEAKYRTAAQDPKLNPPATAVPTNRPVTQVQPTQTIAGQAAAAADKREVEQAAKKAKATKEAELSVPEKASGPERDKLTSMLSSGDLYGQIKALYRKEFVGIVRGGVSATVQEKTGMMSQQEQQFRTAVTTANNQMIKDITGAQMSEAEAARLLRQMPDPTLPPKQFEARLHQTLINQKILAIRRRQVLEATGVDVGKVPMVTLTTEERRAVLEPIARDYAAGSVERDDAIGQLMGLAQYPTREAAAAALRAATGK